MDTETTAPQQNSDLKPDERAALRAFLARGETRVSTMHRTAGTLISGAGLLILLPAFARDALVNIGNAVLSIRTEWIQLLMLVATSILVAIPIAALYLLLRDLVLFHFTSVLPGWDKFEYFYPRYVLQAIWLNTDEVEPTTRARIRRHRSADSFTHYIVPKHENALSQFTQIHKETEGTIGQLADPDQDETTKTANAYKAVFGLTGAVDRDLLAEVAAMEVSIARHTLGLRRIVLRYVKAFLILVVASLGLIALYSYLNHLTSNPFIPNANGDTKAPVNLDSMVIGLIIGYSALAALAPFTARLPILWISRSGDPSIKNKIQNDRDLMEFEFWVGVASLAVISIQCIVLYNYRAGWRGNVLERSNWPRDVALLTCMLGFAYCLIFVVSRYRTTWRL